MTDRSRGRGPAGTAGGRGESRSFARESGRQRRRRRRQPFGFDELDPEDAESRALEGRPAMYDLDEEDLAVGYVSLDDVSLEELQEMAEEMDIEDYEDMTHEELVDSIRERL